LRAKYAEMLAMRLEHEEGREDAQDVRRRMAELALHYPGALREIDDLPLSELHARVLALDAAMRGGRTADWMRAVGLFHALMRGALCAKRWLAGRKRLDGGIEQLFASALPGLSFPDDAEVWQEDLARLAAPPDGRVSSLVFERIAEHLGETQAAARALVFGVSRGRRPRYR
jgi:hypothetical protein